MFCILTPVLAIPIIITLSYGMRETKAQLAVRVKKPLNFSARGVQKAVVNVLWKLDVVGLVLLVVGAGLFLVAITLANSRTSRWYDGQSLFSSSLSLFFSPFRTYSSDSLCSRRMLDSISLTLLISTASSITMLVIGGSGVIGFILWEKYGARYPLIPFSLLRNRSVPFLSPPS